MLHGDDPLMDGSPGSVAAVSDALLQKWAHSVTRRYHRVGADAVAGVVAIGRELNQVKARCPHGSFERLFSGHPQVIGSPIPFGIRVAEMYMSVANEPILSNAQHVADLPRSFGALYELSRLPTRVLTEALKTGRISPEMERHDVRLLREPRGQRSRRPPRSQSRARRNDQRVIAHTLRRLWRRYPEQHPFIIREVHALATNAGCLIPDPWPPAGVDSMSVHHGPRDG
jgi:hypothetical protein